jgi:hypothetical protein
MSQFLSPTHYVDICLGASRVLSLHCLPPVAAVPLLCHCGAAHIHLVWCYYFVVMCLVGVRVLVLFKQLRVCAPYC